MRIGFACVLAVAACSGTAGQTARPPSRVRAAPASTARAAPADFPGFSVTLPEGTLTTDERDDYRHGMVSVKRESGWRLMTLQWANGAVVGDLQQEEEMMISLIRHSGDTLAFKRAFSVATP